MSLTHKKKPITTETFIVLFLVLGVFIALSAYMGVGNFMNTFIGLAYSLLMNVALWIMAVAVLTSAVGAIMSEFGVFALLNKILAPVTKLIYRLPGVSALGVVSAYMSDNPAVISLSKEKEFRKQFKPYQIPVLCNVGTSFGMGIVILIAMFAMSKQAGDLVQTALNSAGTDNEIVYKIMDPSYFDNWNFIAAALVGLAGAIVGSIVSVRLLGYFSRKHYGVGKDPNPIKKMDDEEMVREVREGNAINRALEAALDGGKNGVEIGLQIIPGILIIATLVLMLSNPVPDGGNFTGSINDGIGLLSIIFKPFEPFLSFVFGLSTAEAVSFPLTSLGSAGAAVGMVPTMLVEGHIGIKEIAIFTAMGTVWSGYLSTHISMMDSLGARKLAGKAILAHTLGGLAAGIAANLFFEFFDIFVNFT